MLSLSIYRRLGTVAVMLALLFDATAAAQPVPPTGQQVADAIEDVRRMEPTSGQGYYVAERLNKLIGQLDPQSVDDKIVEDLVSLLAIPNDAIRFWVAAALGHLGPRARKAIPALEALLPDVDCLMGSVTSASSIRIALEQMGVTPPPHKCVGTYRYH